MSTTPTLLRNIKELQDWRLAQGTKTIGFVPTMGYLHRGHLSLVARAREENDLVVVSIFVNPTQFGPKEDLAQYPRDLERDLNLLNGEGVSIVFHPSPGEIYPPGFNTYVEVREITTVLEGAIRPGHFIGVATVVLILLNLVRPQRAYFGQKDAQQLAVIQKMVRELALGVTIVPCPIVREEDGLALSSRNVFLVEADRKAATILSQALQAALDRYMKGERNAHVLRSLVREQIIGESRARLDYVSLANPDNLKELEHLEPGAPALLSVAAHFGSTRLIDNILLSVQ